MERPAIDAARALDVALLGLGDRVAVERDHRVQQIPVERDPGERLQHQLLRRHLAALHRRLHLHDVALDDVEPDKLGANALRGECGGRESQGGGESDSQTTHHGRPPSARSIAR